MSVYAVPQIPTPPDTDDITALREYIQQLANVTAMAMKELDWLLNGNMDVKNIRANAIVANLIKAGEITADKLNVTEISAISANLGTITAGLLQAITIISSTITGSLIQTVASGSYPRAFLSTASTNFGVHGSASETLEVRPGGSNRPLMIYTSATSSTTIFLFGNEWSVQADHNIRITATLGDINLDTPAGNVNINGTSIASSLAGKQNSFTGVTASKVVGAETWNFTNGVLTSIT